MKTLDLIFSAAFGLMAVALFAAGFKNASHFLFAALSALLCGLAIVDYKQEKRKSNERVGRISEGD